MKCFKAGGRGYLALVMVSALMWLAIASAEIAGPLIETRDASTTEQEPKDKAARDEKKQTIVLVVDAHLQKDPSFKNIKQFIQKLSRVYAANYKSVFWSEYSAQLVKEMDAGLIVFSPQGKPWEIYPKEEFQEFLNQVRKTESPMLGICGGHQLISLAFGGEVDPIEQQGARCSHPESYRNCIREKGFTEISFQLDPVFEGLDEEFIAWENHVEEVKTAPPGFIVIALSKTTKIQAIRNKAGAIYGFQFHPENTDSGHKDGEVILRNVFRLLAGGSRPSDGADDVK